MKPALQQALAELDIAKLQVDQVLAREYPVGAAVAWERGGREQSGQVIAHLYHGAIRVLNERTGKRVDLDVRSIL